MRILTGFRNRVPVRYAFGLLLCCLLFFFAVAAKSEIYHHNQSQVKNLTAAKVLENTALVSPRVPAEFNLTIAAFAGFLFLFVTLFYVGGPQQERRAHALTGWYSPDLAVRPPPAI